LSRRGNERFSATTNQKVFLFFFPREESTRAPLFDSVACDGDAEASSRFDRKPSPNPDSRVLSPASEAMAALAAILRAARPSYR